MSHSLATLLGELAAFALAIGFSPLHIALLLLLLVGPDPMRRGSWFVVGWLLTSAAVVGLLLTVGHGLLLTMEKGTSHRTGLDLLAAGALLALGLRELLNRRVDDEPPGWTERLEDFCRLPLPLLLAISAAIEVVSPDDLFLFAKTAGSLLATGLPPQQELLATGLFALASSFLLLLPLLALLAFGTAWCLPRLERSRDWLFARGDGLVGLVSVALAAYLGWQGIEGLRMG